MSINYEKYLDVLPEIQQAIDENKPVVALESTILSHGMPYPENLDFAHRVEETIRALGGIPATCAIVNGRLKVGLTAEELEIMCRAENIGKVSRRDVAVYVALGRTGAGDGDDARRESPASRPFGEEAVQVSI